MQIIPTNSRVNYLVFRYLYSKFCYHCNVNDMIDRSTDKIVPTKKLVIMKLKKYTSIMEKLRHTALLIFIFAFAILNYIIPRGFIFK